MSDKGVATVQCVDWNKIKVAQKKIGLTDEELAKIADTTRQNIVNWRHRNASPSSAEILEKICNVVGLRVEDVIVIPKVIQDDLFTGLLDGLLSLTKLENIINSNGKIIMEIMDKKSYNKLMTEIINTRKDVSSIYSLLEEQKDKVYSVTLK